MLPPEVGSLRFFGQISTTGKKPYIIVEGLSPEEEEDIDDSLQEGRNGANKYCYWVARGYTAAPDDWVKLPNVTMAQVRDTYVLCILIFPSILLYSILFYSLPYYFILTLPFLHFFSSPTHPIINIYLNPSGEG